MPSQRLQNFIRKISTQNILFEIDSIEILFISESNLPDS